MKVVLTENQINKLKSFIFEDTFNEVLPDIKPGDKFTVKSDKGDFTGTVNSVFSNQIFLAQGGNKYVTTSNSYVNDVLIIHQVIDNKAKNKITIPNVDSIQITRDGKLIGNIDNQVRKPEKKKKTIKQTKSKIDDRRFDEYIQDLSSMVIGDVLLLELGFINKETGEVLHDKITKLKFRVEQKLSETKFSLTFLSAVGPEASTYKELKQYDFLYISESSFRIASGGDAMNLVLDTKKGDKISQVYIQGIVGMDSIADEPLEITAADILKNPTLRKAYLQNPSFVDKLLGVQGKKGLIPALDKLKKYGLGSRLKKNKKVLFKITDGSVGNPTFTLSDGKTYSAKVKDDNKIVHSLDRKGNKFNILLTRTGNNEYDATFNLVNKNGEIIKSDESKLKMIDYDF